MRRFRVGATVSILVMTFGLMQSTAVGADPLDLPRIAPGVGYQVEGDDGTALLQIPVTLSAPSTEVVSAPWSTIFGPGVNPPSPATPGIDFSAANGTITFAPGETSAVIPITITGDTEIEADEVVVVSVGPPTNAVRGGYFGLGFGVITDDDTLPHLVAGVAAQPEGDTGTSAVSIPVTLSAPSTKTVTAPWTTIFGPGVNPPSPATPGIDFATTSGTVTFSPGQTHRVITVPIFGDEAIEPDESIVVALGRPTNAIRGGYYGLGFGVIENDDSPVPRTISVTPQFGNAGGDTVIVSGTGWTPNAGVGLCQAVNNSTLTPPQSACLAGVGTQTTITTESDGTFSLPWSLYRWGYVPGLDQWIDCAGPSSTPGCVIGAGELADLAGTVTATGRLPWAVPSPPAQRGQLTVSPDTDVPDDATVMVTGSGFRADRVIDIYQCAVEPTFASPSGCQPNTRIRVSADSSGEFSVPFAVTSADGSFVTAAEAVDFVGTYVTQPIAFAAGP